LTIAAAVSGTISGYKTLADGTLRLTIDLNEPQANIYHQFFHGLHIEVAVARLENEETP
jgi:hypothetical protein